MLNINYLEIDLDKAKKEHVNFFTCYINKRLFGKTCFELDSNYKHESFGQFCNEIKRRKPVSKPKDLKVLIDFFRSNDNVKKLLSSNPNELLELNENFQRVVDEHFGTGRYSEYFALSKDERPKKVKLYRFFKDLNDILNYSKLSTDNHYSSYTLTANLGIRACVYCNRSYTVTQRKQNNGRLMNPQLDHWFPQSKFPLLQISFFNLIPSCEFCNSRVKNDLVLDLDQHFHPYQENKENLVFDYYETGTPEEYRIFFGTKSDTKIKKVCEDMCIDEMYNAHIPELKDLIKLKKAYSETYLDSIKKSFSGLNLSDQELYRLAFGTEYLEKKFHLYPLSKFKYDILHRDKK